MVQLAPIETEIVNVLKTISELKTVLDYEPLEVNLMPAATLFYTGYNLTEGAMPHAQRLTHRWAIRVYVQLQDAEKAQDELKTLIPKVANAFRLNRDINGSCEFSTLTECSVGVVLDQNKAQLVADFTLVVEVEER